MRTFLTPYTDGLYALMRFMTGALFVFHGTQKLFGWPGTKPPAELLSLRGLAGIIETFGGGMIALGFLAAWAAFIASGTMAVAYFMSHAGDGFLPIINRGELAVGIQHRRAAHANAKLTDTAAIPIMTCTAICAQKAGCSPAFFHLHGGFDRE